MGSVGVCVCWLAGTQAYSMLIAGMEAHGRLNVCGDGPLPGQRGSVGSFCRAT